MREAIEGTTGSHYTAIDSTNDVFDTGDTVAKGKKSELTANPVKGLSFTANYATLRVESANNSPTQSAYIAQFMPQWTAANPNLRRLSPTQPLPANGTELRQAQADDSGQPQS